MRPPHGIKFSKSAASLPHSDVSSIGGDGEGATSGNTTPTSGISRMRFQDFSILSVIGQGSYGKVYHVIPKLQKMKSDNNLLQHTQDSMSNDGST